MKKKVQISLTIEVEYPGLKETKKLSNDFDKWIRDMLLVESEFGWCPTMYPPGEEWEGKSLGEAKITINGKKLQGKKWKSDSTRYNDIYMGKPVKPGKK